MKLPSRANLQTPGVPVNIPRNALRLFAGGFALSLISVVLALCARMLPGFAQQYSVTVYPVLVNILGRFSGLFPFSLSEAGVYLTGAFCLMNILILLGKVLTGKTLPCRSLPGDNLPENPPLPGKGQFRLPLPALARIFFFVSLLLFLYTINCGINYDRTPFSYEAGMVMKKSSKKELYNLCLFLIKQVNSSLEEVDHSQDSLSGLYPGQTADTPPPSFAALRQMGLEGVASMNRLGDTYPQLGGFYPYPKPLINPGLLSIQQLCGIYSPFTIEANYNREMPYYNIPHTICHELSHLKGYMREDEANFIGYLACIGSQSPDFRYSGYLTGWVYAGNALAKVDLAAYYELQAMLSPKAAQDLIWNNQFWAKYDGKVAQASTQLNDRYLKANRQEDGVQSYGRMVDLMLAYYGDCFE